MVLSHLPGINVQSLFGFVFVHYILDNFHLFLGQIIAKQSLLSNSLLTKYNKNVSMQDNSFIQYSEIFVSKQL